MASIERTAYPRFPRTLTLKDLQASFTPRPDETGWALRYARGPERRLALLVLLKCFQFMRHFPAVDEIPAEIVEHVSATLGAPPTQSIEYPAAHTALYRRRGRAGRCASRPDPPERDNPHPRIGCPAATIDGVPKPVVVLARRGVVAIVRNGAMSAGAALRDRVCLTDVL